MKNMKKLLALALVIVSVLAIALPAMAVTTGVYNDVAVYLRTGVDSSSYYGRVNKGTTCNILESKHGNNNRLWYRVKITSNTTNDGINLNGVEGWSWASYIDVTSGNTPSSRPKNKAEAFGPAGVYLQNGSTGKYVYNLQLVLAATGYYSGELDRDFGPQTQNAVEDFQRNKLGASEVDGIVGEKTKTKLWEVGSGVLLESGIK